LNEVEVDDGGVVSDGCDDTFEFTSESLTIEEVNSDDSVDPGVGVL
jgi:hypothetical protein